MMSCTGNRWLRTPNMDALAAEGMRFERAYAANPVCVPSRFSLMTGRYPSAMGLQGNVPDEQGAAAAQRLYREGMGWRLREAGYDPLYAGKQHLPAGCAEDVGFRVLSADEREPMAHDCARFLGEDHDAPFALVASFINPHDICYMAIRDAIGTAYETASMRDLIGRGEQEIAALDAALRLPDGVTEEAFFENWCPPLPANHEPQEDEPEAIVARLRKSGFQLYARERYTEERWRMHRWAYARLTEQVDREIGIVLEALRESGRDRETVILFTSDHGDHDSSHRLEHKTMPYEEATRIPLIVRPAGGARSAGVDSAHLVCNGIDLLPTVCDYAGGRAADLEGRSLRPLVEGESAPDWRASVRVESEVAETVITERYQYSLFDSGGHCEQLYDRVRDPGQTRNWAGDPGLADVLEEHRCLLAESAPKG